MFSFIKKNWTDYLLVTYITIFVTIMLQVLAENTLRNVTYVIIILHTLFGKTQDKQQRNLM